MRITLSVLAGIAGFVSAICLYFGSRETPWGIQSWGGETEREGVFQRRRRRAAIAGFALLALAFLLQTLALFVP